MASYADSVEFVYAAAAFGVVPALLLVFDRLSRPPERRTRRENDASAQEAGSVADEAERWLQGRW